MGETLCDLEENDNLMLLSTFDKIEGLTLRPCFMDIGHADYREAAPTGMVKDLMIDIKVFKIKVNVIVSKNKKKQDCPLILGRSF